MTKLFEWLGLVGIFTGVWAILLTKQSSDPSDFVRHFVLFLPFYALLGFAVSRYVFHSLLIQVYLVFPHIQTSIINIFLGCFRLHHCFSGLHI